jgi:hypothetical protein
MRARTTLTAVVVACSVSMLGAGTVQAASPGAATLTPDAQGKGKVTWSGSVSAGTADNGTTDDCFGADKKPDPTSGCDFFTLTVSTPAGFYSQFLGGVQFTVTGFAPFDLDLGIYRLNADGTHGEKAGSSGNLPGMDEITTVAQAEGKYIVALVPYAAPPLTPYTAVAGFNLKKANPTLPVLNHRLGAGPANYRASHDQYVSHSEPFIAMDPLNHNHLVAGSKMYESLPKYFFKAGTYESFDGGKTWKDWGQLPGYCQDVGQCDPNDDAHYRVVSDIITAFDDEGNAYTNTLDAPGGATGTGWNQTLHIKQPGKPWSQPIVVHDNRNNPISQQLLLDDKNFLAVDNVTHVDGSPNKPHDGKIGTMYVCWGLDGATAPTQQIVLMRSLDGGHTWGGEVPGDNTPIQLSQKQAISGIGCHVIIGPQGEVYVTWYDNQVDAMMQVKSTDHGATFTPARPVVMISGVNSQFEGQSFRNLSIPTTGIDSQGNIYIVSTSQDGNGNPVLAGMSAERIKEIRDGWRAEAEAAGAQSTGSDIVLFKSTDGGQTYQGPVRVNQDPKTLNADQFQPWMAITPRGQLDIMYFDRRNDPNNWFIGEYLSRSNDGGKTFTDTRFDHQMWDPRINPPISPSGQFIGDYQGIVADDNVAIPFWNDTQAANLPASSKGHSPWQEVYAARIPNTQGKGGPCRDRKPPRSTLKRNGIKVTGKGFTVSGRSTDQGCKGLTAATSLKGGIQKVFVSVARVLRSGSGCRFLQANGKFGKARNCNHGVLLPASGTRKWKFTSQVKLKPGTYRFVARARDRSGNKEKPAKRRNRVVFQVR